MKHFKNKRRSFNPIKGGTARFKKAWRGWKDFHAVAGRFYPYIKKNRNRLLLAQTFALGYMVTGILEPWPIKMIFDNIFLNHPLPSFLTPLFGSGGERPLLLLGVLIGSIILIAAMRGVFYYYQQLLTSRSGQQITASMRVDLYSHLQNLCFSFHDRRRTGDMIARLTTDIRILRQILISLPLTVISELCLMLCMIVIIFLMDWRLSLLALMVIPVIALLLKDYQRPMKRAIRKQREREGHLAGIAAEVLGAIKVVQGFHQEDSEVKRFTVQNKSSLRSGLKAARLEAKLKWASELAVAFVTAIVIGVAARQVITGALSPGDVLVFLAYLKKFNRPIRRVSRFSEQAARGTASGERILKMLDIKPTIKDRPKAVACGRLAGEINYEHVTFNYRNGPTILHDVSFHIEPGQRIAVVGPTGCGKSTLVSLLPRFYDPAKGSVLCDGEDIRKYTLQSLRQNISMVFQEPVLFATTIKENIAYGRPEASMEEIVKAAKKAKIHHIIEALEDGYETTLGERGGTLSGGQRQCIAIARAIVKDAPLVVMDEPTSGLDDKSATLVMDALGELMSGKTVIMISHQLRTIQDVDEVLVLRKGRIVQHGDPEKALSESGLFTAFLHADSKRFVA